VNRQNLECGGRGELAPRPAGVRAGDTAFLQEGRSQEYGGSVNENGDPSPLSSAEMAGQRKLIFVATKGWNEGLVPFRRAPDLTRVQCFSHYR
jgi:hypothetical protein